MIDSLDEVLSKEGLEDLLPFNRVYLEVEKNLKLQIEAGYFHDSVTMERLNRYFLELYFEAINGFINNKNIAGAWQILLVKESLWDPSVSLLALLGANAHINNDLSQALLKTNPPVTFKRDYLRFTRILKKSLQISVKKSKTGQLIYLPLVNLVLKRWRTLAWENFLALKENTLEKKQIEESAAKNAKKIIKLVGFVS